MPTLFSRRPRTGGSRFGQGISSSDLLDRPDSPSNQDARPLPAIPFDGGLPPDIMGSSGDTSYDARSDTTARRTRAAVDTATPTDYSRTTTAAAAASSRTINGSTTVLSPTTSRALTTEFGHLEAMRARGNGPSSSSAFLTAPSAAGRTSVSSTVRTGPKRAGTLPLSGRASPSGLPSPASASVWSVPDQPESYPYGYAHEGWDVQLDCARVVQLVGALGEQIRSRGLDSPLIFSSMALDLSPSSTCSLIRSYLASGVAGRSAANLLTPRMGGGGGGASPDPNAFANGTSLPTGFLSDIRFANSHDLAAMLKWALARMGRVFAVPVPASATEGPNRRGEVQEEMIFVQQRGFLDIHSYMAWREDEKARGYPATAFAAFVDGLIDPASATLLRALLSLLSSTTSYSLKNGMTPSKLSRLFGVLLFGVPEDDTFERTYEAFVTASNATEHLLLAYIRDIGSGESLPMRLAEHINGYPAMIASDVRKPPKHVRGVPVTQIERLVRLYSADLVQTACEMNLAPTCQEWAACCGEIDLYGKDPQLSDRFRKLVNLRGSARQGRRADGTSGGASVRSASSQGLRNPDDDVEAYGSLAAKDWGDFMLDGFALPDQSKLNFDLRESERKARREKRQTVAWSQFEELGFVASDDGLNDVLNFDDGLKEDMDRWPGERAELMDKLRERAKKLPAFAYDNTPKCIAAPSIEPSKAGQWDLEPFSRMDEVFAEVWADYCLGSGWSNRDELTHRNANFVVVQYKSRPSPWTVGSQSGPAAKLPTSISIAREAEPSITAAPDPRVDAAWFVIQEIVPSQYRADLDAAGRSKGRSKPSLRKLNIFKRVKKDRSADDHVDPNDPFRPGAGGVTKQLRLTDPAARGFGGGVMAADLERAGSYTTTRTREQRRADAGIPSGLQYDHSVVVPSNVAPQPSDEPTGARLLQHLRSRTKRGRGTGSENDGDVAPAVPPKNGSAALSSQPRGMAETRTDSFGSSDFDTRSVEDSDAGDFASPQPTSRLKNPLKHQRRESKDDSWLDVMIKANGFRMAGQDAPAGSRLKASPAHANSFSEPGPARGIPDAAQLTFPPRDASLPGSRRATPTPTQDEDRATTPNAAVVTSPVAAIAAAGWSLEKGTTSTPVKTATVSPPLLWKDDPLETAAEVRSSPKNARRPAALEIVTPTFAAQRTPSPSPSRILTEVQPISDANASAKDAATLGLPPKSPARTSPTRAEMIPPPRSPLRAARAPERETAPSGPMPAPMPPLLDAELERRVLPVVPAIGTNLAEREKARQARIEAAKERARELRAGLQQVDTSKAAAASAAKTPEAATTPSPSGIPRPRVDPFAKNPTVGRVAAVASKFGGPGKPAASLPVSPQDTGSSVSSLASPSKTALSASSAAAREQGPKTPTKELPHYPIPAPILTSPSRVADSVRSQPHDFIDPEAPPSPRPRTSQDSALRGDADSIYPDDAASNYSRSTDEGADTVSLTNANNNSAAKLGLFSGHRSTSELGGFPGDEGRREEEDMPTDMQRRTPYQPGMPLDNVLEESESMLSGSNNNH